MRDSLPLSLYLSHTLFFSLSLTLFTGQRERESEREIKGEEERYKVQGILKGEVSLYC
jgi:hypothetical protein